MVKQKDYLSLARLLPVELILILYLLLTGILILSRCSSLSYPWIHLSIRLIIIGVIIGFTRWNFSPVSRITYYTRLMFPIVLLGYLYNETGYLNHLLISHNLDPLISSFDSGLFGIQPSIRFSQVIHSNVFAELMYFGYFAYYLLIIGTPVAITIYSGKKQAQEAVFIMIHSFFVYYIVFIILPVVGPQFYFTNLEPLPQGYLFGPILRFIQHVGEAPTAAFPSSHVSIALMILVLNTKYAKPLLRFAGPVIVLLIVSTVYIRAHYVADVLAAFIVTPFLYYISHLVYTNLQSNISKHEFRINRG